LFWGWTWLAGIAVVIMLGVLLLPWFFFLLNLQALLNNVAPPNRRMPPGHVWLNFIPVFNLGWFIYTVIKVKDSVGAEFRTRSWFVDGDLGYNVGLTAGILWVASFVIGWIPFIGWVLPLAAVICWIVYWLKMADLKNRLEARPAWNRPYQQMYPPAFPPDGPRYMTDREVTAVGGAQGTGQPGDARSEDPTGEHDQEQPRDYRCPACGAHFDEGDWFCRKCGSRLY
jgi:zinc-ribbon domain